MVAILPGAMIGPNCFNLTPTMKLLEMIFRGRLPADAGFKFNFIDVIDVAAASVVAAVHGRPGERYLLANAATGVALPAALTPDGRRIARLAAQMQHVVGYEKSPLSRGRADDHSRRREHGLHVLLVAATVDTSE
jgi:hypothetical protein